MKIGVVAGGAMILGPVEGGLDDGPAGPESWHPRAWLTIEADGWVILTVHKAEMGQGVQTSLAVLIAEELDVPFQQIRTRWAPLSPDYHEGYGQTTSASKSLFRSWQPLRRLGAAARLMIMAAAAKRWRVEASACSTSAGIVICGDRRLSYADLLQEAMKQPVPPVVPLKKPSQWKLIGKSQTRLDARDKVTGKAVFGADVRLPGMLFARVIQPPRYGSSLQGMDDTAARTLPGVRHVAALKYDSRDLVFVVADNIYQAQKGRQALKLTWTGGSHVDQAVLNRQREALFSREPASQITGNPNTALAEASRKVTARYTTPYLAHVCMAPMTATAVVRDGWCHIHAPMQNLTRPQEYAAAITGLPPQKIRVNNTYLGGGFGRRVHPEYVAQAILIAHHLGVPVQVQWTREDDLKQGYYHPAATCRMTAGLNAAGTPVAWLHQTAALTNTPVPVRAGGDECDYTIDHTRFDAFALNPEEPEPVPTGLYRSVGRLQNVFARESFMDELAHEMGVDPVAYRLGLLGDTRLKAVLERAAAEAGWPGSDNQALGLAINADRVYLNESFRSRGAVVARMEKSGHLSRVIAVVDCGIPVDPDTVEAQVKGAVVFGLNILYEKAVTFKAGAVVESNFHNHPVLRTSAVPKIKVVIIPRNDVPIGIGELPVPLTLAAVCNALFRATGKRVRDLPLEPALQHVRET